MLAFFIYCAFLHKGSHNGYGSFADDKDPMWRHRPQSEKEQRFSIITLLVSILSFFTFLHFVSLNL